MAEVLTITGLRKQLFKVIDGVVEISVHPRLEIAAKWTYCQISFWRRKKVS